MLEKKKKPEYAERIKDVLKRKRCCVITLPLMIHFVPLINDFLSLLFVDKPSAQQQQILPDAAVGGRQRQTLQCVASMGQR